MDSVIYLNCAAQCAAGGQCWHDIRPVGYVLYASLPFRMGWRPEAVIAMNMAMILLSAWLANAAVNALLPRLRTLAWPLKPLKLGLIGALHFYLMRNSIHYALADVPAACAGLSSIWLLILAVDRNRPWWLVASGGALGAAVIVRSFYLYPALGLVAGVLLLALLRRVAWSAAYGFLLAAALMVLSQYALTYRYTGVWSFLEPRRSADYIASEMALAGYGGGQTSSDPVIGADPVRDVMVWYTCDDCADLKGGWPAALKQRNYRGILHLLLRRNAFYFASDAPQAVLADESQRQWPGWLWKVNLLALLLALWAYLRMPRPLLGLIPLGFVGACWTTALGIHPETRFIMLVQTFLWVLAGAILFLPLTRGTLAAQEEDHA
jgi:hypothetical protein